MLVLRLLVMMLSIICLMHGDAEVNSSPTEIRNFEDGSVVKTDGMEVQTLNRRKKKKSKKTNKGKKPKQKGKSKPSKQVTKAPATASSTSKTSTSILTQTTTTATTTVTATTTASSTITSVMTTTSSTSTSTITTSIKEKTITIVTSAGSGGECKTTGGKPCVFPFKTGDEEFNECKDHDGKYFWCATTLYESGKYMHWSYCPKDGSCPLEVKTTTAGGCKATNNKPCIFPFKDGKKEYTQCADYQGSYFWCATATNSAGHYTTWARCPKDGTCPLLGQTSVSPALMTSTTTANPTSLPSNGTISPASSAVTDIEKMMTEISSALQSSSSSSEEQCPSETTEFTESESKLLQIMDDLIKYMQSDCLGDSCDPEKLTTFKTNLELIISDLKATEKRNHHASTIFEVYQEKQLVMKQMSINTKLYFANVGDRLTISYSSVDYVGAVKKKLGCCLDCKHKYPFDDTQLSEEVKSSKYCYCYKTSEKNSPMTTYNSGFLSSICDLCPSGFKYKNGYESRTYKKSRGDFSSVPHIADCKIKCKELDCLTFSYSSKDKLCELHTSLVASPSEPLYKDYRLCAKENQETEGNQGTCSAAWLTKHQGVPYEDELKDHRIYGGLEVYNNRRWPWAASLKITTDVDSEDLAEEDKFCGGVLISCDFVITAQHCLYDETKDTYPPMVPPEYVHISLGSVYAMEGELFFGDKIYYVPPGWVDDTIMKYDIAIIKLDRPINRASNIRPILLPNKDVTPITVPSPLVRSIEFYVTGWGDTPYFTDVLKETNELKIRSNDICNKNKLFSGPEPQIICYERFARTPPVGLCDGDSGSPGMIQYEDTKWRLHAIVSFDDGEKNDDCTKSGFGGMANVFFYKSYIDTILSGGLPNGFVIKY